MAVSVSSQALDYLIACLVGAALGALYDVFRIIRLAAQCKKAAVFFQDVFFLICCAVITFLLLLRESLGVIRFFVLFGELLGAILYFMTLGVLIMKLAHKAIPGARNLAGRLCGALEPPLRRTSDKIDLEMLQKTRKAKKLYLKGNKLLKIRLKVAQTMMYNLLRIQKVQDKAKRPEKKLRRRQRRGKQAS